MVKLKEIYSHFAKTLLPRFNFFRVNNLLKNKLTIRFHLKLVSLVLTIYYLELLGHKADAVAFENLFYLNQTYITAYSKNALS